MKISSTIPYTVHSRTSKNAVTFGQEAKDYYRSSFKDLQGFETSSGGNFLSKGIKVVTDSDLEKPRIVDITETLYDNFNGSENSYNIKTRPVDPKERGYGGISRFDTYVETGRELRGTTKSYTLSNIKGIDVLTNEKCDIPVTRGSHVFPFLDIFQKINDKSLNASQLQRLFSPDVQINPVLKFMQFLNDSAQQVADYGSEIFTKEYNEAAKRLEKEMVNPWQKIIKNLPK